MGKERERQAGQRKQNNTRRKNNNRASEKTPYLTIKRKQKNAGRESDRRNTDKVHTEKDDQTILMDQHSVDTAKHVLPFVYLE